MVKRIREYIKYTRKELEEYTRIKDSCINKVNNSMHIGLPPHGLSNLRDGILEIIAHQKIGFFDTKLKGIILDVKNIKILGDIGTIRADDPIIHLNIRADCYVFQPEIGAVIRGIVKHISGSCLIGVIIYRVFSVSIKLEDHAKKHFQINSEIEFRIKNFDLQSSMPFIEGELTAKEEEFDQQEITNFKDEEDDEVSNDSSVENKYQIVSQNKEQNNYAEESDGSEDLFGTQQSTQIELSQPSENRRRYEEEVKVEDNNFNIDSKGNAANDTKYNEENTEEEERVELTQHKKKKKKNTNDKTERSISPNKRVKSISDLLNTIKVEEINNDVSLSKQIKRERTVSKTLSSLGGSFDNLLVKIEMEEIEFLDTENNQVREKDAIGSEKSNSKQEQSKEISQDDSVIEISNDNCDTIIESVELNKIDKRSNKNNCEEMYSDVESGKSDKENRNKKIKKKSQNNIINSINDLLKKVSAEKLSEEIGNKSQQNDKLSIHSESIISSKKKSKKKSNLNDSVFDILSTIKTEKLNSTRAENVPHNEKIHEEQHQQQQEQNSVTLENNQIASDLESTSSKKTTASKKKKNKNKLKDSLCDIISMITNEKLNSSSNEKEIEDNSNRQKKNETVKKMKTKKSTSTSGSQLENGIRRKRINSNSTENDDQNVNKKTIPMDSTSNENKSKRSKHKSLKLANSMQNILEAIKKEKAEESEGSGKSKRKRKNSLRDSISQIINESLSQDETVTNFLSSPLLSSTMINPKKRKN